MQRHDLQARRVARRPHRADGAVHARSAGRATGRTRRCCAASCTTRRRGAWAAWPGHAGLFSTAADLSIFCRMLLDGGRYGQARVLSPLTVAKMTAPGAGARRRPRPRLGHRLRLLVEPRRAAADRIVRAHGLHRHVDLDRPGHRHVRGVPVEPRPPRRQGRRDAAPRARRDGRRRRRSLEIPADAPQPLRMTGGDFGARRAPAARRVEPPVLNGIDVLRAEGFASLDGRRVGLVTNHTGSRRTARRRSTCSPRAKDLTLVALFSPEHGIRGHARRRTSPSAKRREDRPADPLALRRDDAADRRRCWKGIDTLVFDIQDIGVRFYTYVTTMAYVLEEAAKRKIPVVVLDRSNPINGWMVEGPGARQGAPSASSATSPDADPPRHDDGRAGAAVQRREQDRRRPDRGADCKGWRRDDWFDETGLPWINPSPNMRNLIQATLYPGIGAIEDRTSRSGAAPTRRSSRSARRGSTGGGSPRALNARRIPGIRFYPVRSRRRRASTRASAAAASS